MPPLFEKENNMNAEELFEKYQYLAKITLKKLFPEVHNFSRAVRLEYDDLMQFALMGLWVGCKSYCENKHNTSVKSHLIRNIRWYTLREVQKQNSKFQYYKSKTNDENNRVKVLSINSKIGNEMDSDDTTYEDILSTDNIFKHESYNPEKIVMSSLGKEEILKLLKPKDLKLLHLRMNEGLTYQQIADMYGVKRQAIGAKFVRIQNKLNRCLGVV
jgi:RNA polymerase sigma factor (sigma-70 family)